MTVTRGTSNTNERGSAAARRARKNYLLDVYAADYDAPQPYVTWTGHSPQRDDAFFHLESVPKGTGIPACRCYRCGTLLTYGTMEVDRIKPGCMGGTYARSNIRPVCEKCNKKTGNIAKAEKAAKRKHRNELAKARRDAKLAVAAFDKMFHISPGYRAQLDAQAAFADECRNDH